MLGTYQLDHTSRSGLVGLLGIEQKTLPGLGSPRDDMVGNIGSLLVLQVGSELITSQSIGAEPEVVLGVDDVPMVIC